MDKEQEQRLLEALNEFRRDEYWDSIDAIPEDGIIPIGYTTYVVPRSSTFKHYGIILVNSIGVIDSSYCGDEDEWKGMFIALRDGKVSYNDRLLQFDISPVWIKKDDLVEVETLGNENRGGYGTTGVK